MKVISKDVLDRFIKKHSEMKNAVLTWKEVVQGQSWETPHNVKETFPKASHIGNCDWWFDLNYGGYRLLAKVNFNMKAVMVISVNTHDEYLRISNKRKS
ncbi:MAG: type II toxin-antitoxin system HigB family toxin [Candidatus Cloacimonetes bacterium]|nr:type II toxin-antitoxin system HigB family toxin [Candidatus Cloacimonadota bacterium]